MRIWMGIFFLANECMPDPLRIYGCFVWPRHLVSPRAPTGGYRSGLTLLSTRVRQVVGRSERSVSELFAAARAAAPCILFLDQVQWMQCRQPPSCRMRNSFSLFSLQAVMNTEERGPYLVNHELNYTCIAVGEYRHCTWLSFYTARHDPVTRSSPFTMKWGKPVMLFGARVNTWQVVLLET